MENIKFKLEIECTITPQDIEELMVTALEGGINYWCGECAVINYPDSAENILLSECFSEGYNLRLYDIEDPKDNWELTIDKFIKGIKMEMINAGYYSVEDLINYHDAGTADNIIQFALFDKLIFCLI